MIKKLLKSLREYKKPTLFTIFCAAMEVVFEILIPLCMSDLLDFGIEGGKMKVKYRARVPFVTQESLFVNENLIL